MNCAASDAYAGDWAGIAVAARPAALPPPPPPLLLLLLLLSLVLLKYISTWA